MDVQDRQDGLTILPDSALGWVMGWWQVVEHLPLTAAWGHIVGSGSGQALPRHSLDIAYRCFLPDLAEFTSLRRVGPGRQRHSLRQRPLRLAEGRNSTPLWRIEGIGHRQLPV